MSAIYMCFGFAYMIYLTFFQRRLTVDLGLSNVAAGNLFLLVGIASIVCGFLWGAVSDRIGRGRALALNLLLQASGAALLAWATSTPGLVISALCSGLAAVAVPGIVGAGCGDRFGPLLASTSLGFVTVFLGLGQVIGPYVAGRLADSFGTLEYSYLLSGAVYLVAMSLAIAIRDPKALPRPR
jgi:MFS family permease